MGIGSSGGQGFDKARSVIASGGEAGPPPHRLNLFVLSLPYLVPKSPVWVGHEASCHIYDSTGLGTTMPH